MYKRTFDEATITQLIELQWQQLHKRIHSNLNLFCICSSVTSIDWYIL